jgi:hypothetical protein
MAIRRHTRLASVARPKVLPAAKVLLPTTKGLRSARVGTTNYKEGSPVSRHPIPDLAIGSEVAPGRKQSMGGKDSTGRAGHRRKGKAID